jgi:hypothetical protein
VDKVDIKKSNIKYFRTEYAEMTSHKADHEN